MIAVLSIYNFNVWSLSTSFLLTGGMTVEIPTKSKAFR